MSPIKALIADDERLARNRIRRLLSLDADIEIAGECESGTQTVEAMRAQQPHLLFLDIQMPGLDGFGVLEAVDREKFPVVVFVTAYDAYALKAFEVHAFDYLLKPFDRKRFHEVLKRAKQQVTLIRSGETNSRLLELIENLDSQRPGVGRIAIRSGGHVALVKTDSIDWVEAADNYVCLHCGAETHIVRETMNSFEQRLDPHRFLRIHRSTIVNLDQVKEMLPWFRGDYQVILHTGAKLTLSRSYRDKLRGVLLKTSL
ncbi:MAG: LytTR family DNA-binding domain-containing protein [Bryobacteraceae bacterium]